MTLKWWQAILLSLLIIDLALLNFSIFSPKQSPKIVAGDVPAPTVTDTCGPVCQKYIDDKISQSLSNLPTSQPTSVVVSSAPIYKSKIKSISYLPVPGNGSTGSNNWSDISGTDFYFDTADYPGLVSIYFETNIKLFNGNGTAFVRLYDVTHGVGVQGSEVKTNYQQDTAVVSGQVSFYQGKNFIRVQAKSLTADTAIFSSGRLKIITEN